MQRSHVMLLIHCLLRLYTKATCLKEKLEIRKYTTIDFYNYHGEIYVSKLPTTFLKRAVKALKMPPELFTIFNFCCINIAKISFPFFFLIVALIIFIFYFVFFFFSIFFSGALLTMQFSCIEILLC